MNPESEGGLPQAEHDPATPPEAKQDHGPDAEAGDTEADSEPASSRDDPDDIPKGVKKRIVRAVRDRDVERGLRADAERDNERLRAELARVRSGGADPKPEERKPEAQREDDPAKRRDAVEWKSKVDDFQDDGEEKYGDFIEKVVENPRVQITKTMAQELMDIDNGVDVAYYLGQHPKESRRIAALPANAQAREIGKLEVTVANQSQAKKPAVKVSSAPRPIEPVAGGKVVSKGLRPDSSMEDFIKATR